MSEQPPARRTAVDHRLRALSVPRRLMPAILAIYAGGGNGAESVSSELETDALVIQNRLDPLVTTLIDIMTSPDLVVTAEVSKADGEQLTTFWATATHAVVGATSDRSQFELIQIEPGLLPFHLAQATGATPRPPSRFTGGCLLPERALQSAETLIVSEPRRAAATLRAGGVPWIWADRVCEALARKRAVWTVDSVSLPQNARHSQPPLRVLDAGPGGYWRLRQRRSSEIVSMQVIDFETVLELLISMLPGHSPR